MNENIKLIHGDCLLKIKDISTSSIDLVVTDPPYCIGTTSNGKRGSWSDNNLIRPFFEQFFEELRRITKDTSEVYINTDWRTYPFLYPIMQNYFEIKNLIIWDYEWIKAGSFYRFSHEIIIYGVRENAKRRFSASERDVWRIKPINYTNKNKLHNSQKPIELIIKIIKNSSCEGDTIFDAFSGSGTTAVACLMTNRKFIGFEIDDKYFKIATDRINKAILDNKMKLF